jgi:hypothetical protein
MSCGVTVVVGIFWNATTLVGILQNASQFRKFIPDLLG